MKRILQYYPDICVVVLLSACTVSMCAVIMCLIYRRKVVRIFDVLNDMLDDVMKGDFDEKIFNESRLSAFESRFAHYFLSSRLSEQNVAEERNKIKGLVTDISHQTKTPIANIILYSELLLENCEDDDARRDIDALYQQAKKLNFLIASLVKISRLETGIVTVCPDKNNVIHLVEHIYSQYRQTAEQKGLYMKLSGYDAQQKFYMARYDEKWTAEAIGNIVDNAIKYTEKGGITISIKPYELFCCIEIADTGIGIPEEEISKVFKRFYRSQSVSQIQGIGIGLYLAREIISSEGGYIKSTSKIEEGTRFSVYLPL